MPNQRMAIPVNDDRGTYSIPPGVRRRRYNPDRFSLDAAYADDVPDPEVVEELTGWGDYKWAVRFGSRTYFVTGADRP